MLRKEAALVIIGGEKRGINNNNESKNQQADTILELLLDPVPRGEGSFFFRVYFTR